MALGAMFFTSCKITAKADESQHVNILQISLHPLPLSQPLSHLHLKFFRKTKLQICLAENLKWLAAKEYASAFELK